MMAQIGDVLRITQPQWVKFISPTCEFALSWIPHNSIYDKFSLVQVMVWFHCLSQRWPRSVASLGHNELKRSSLKKNKISLYSSYFCQCFLLHRNTIALTFLFYVVIIYVVHLIVFGKMSRNGFMSLFFLFLFSLKTQIYMFLGCCFFQLHKTFNFKPVLF